MFCKNMCKTFLEFIRQIFEFREINEVSEKRERCEKERLDLISSCDESVLNIFSSFDELYSVIRATFKLKNKF